MNRADRGSASAARAIQHELQGPLQSLRAMGHQVLNPEDAPQPVFNPDTQNILVEWLHEIWSADDLRAVKTKPRKTALLFGPPGVGKTTGAHHLAMRLNMPLIAVQAQWISSSYVAEGGRNVTKLFDVLDPIADKVVVLLDEFDSLGAKRTSGQAADHERTAVLNALLTRIERYEGVAIAATNRSDEIDAAMWRRFHLQIPIAVPEPDQVYSIICMYLDPFEMDKDAIEVLLAACGNATPDTIKKLIEGIKRALVLGPKLGRNVSDPRAMIANVARSIVPISDDGSGVAMALPPLWSPDAQERRKWLDRLATIKWPPTLKVEPKQ